MLLVAKMAHITHTIPQHTHTHTHTQKQRTPHQTRTPPPWASLTCLLCMPPGVEVGTECCQVHVSGQQDFQEGTHITVTSHVKNQHPTYATTEWSECMILITIKTFFFAKKRNSFFGLTVCNVWYIRPTENSLLRTMTTVRVWRQFDLCGF